MNSIKNLSNEDIEELFKYDIFELEIKLSTLFGNDRFGKDLKVGAFIDSYTNLFVYAKENDLSTSQLSSLLKLQEDLFKQCEEGCSIDENMKFLRQSLVTFPFGDNQKAMKSIINYILKSFYQHYHLYQYITTRQQTVIQLTKIVEIEAIPNTTSYPAPLEESITESLYEEYLNPKPKEKMSEKNTLEEDSSNTTIVSEETNTDDDVNTLLASLHPDELKKLIQEVADSRFNSVKTELETKIVERETAMTKTFNRLQPH